MQRARRYRRALESKRPKGNLSRPRPGPLQQRPRRTAGWACSLPCALRRLPTGVPGRKRWAMGTYGNHVWRRHVYKHWRAAAPADRPFARPTPLQTFCEARAGGNAPLGQNSSAPHAQPRVPGRPGLATGLTAGSSTHRVHAHSTFVIVCCCPPWSRLTRHCCWPSRAHKPPRGSRLYPRTGRPRCRGRSCRSLFDDASGCHHLWAPASAANMGAVRPLGRPRPRLHTQWPFGTPKRSWSSKPGSQYAARRWERRDTLSPSSGCRTRRRQESRRQTADASTSWPRGVRRIAPAPRPLLRCHAG